MESLSEDGSDASATSATAAAKGLVNLKFGSLLISKDVIERLSPFGRLLAAAERLEKAPRAENETTDRSPQPRAVPLRFRPVRSFASENF